MNKTLLIKQPAGIGDILFCQKIAKQIQSNTEYKNVIWPVSNQYSYLKDYLIEDQINFCDESSDFNYKDIYIQNNGIIQNDELLFMSLDQSSQYVTSCRCHNNPLAHGHIKYNFADINYSDWKNYFNIKRNFNREENLIKILGIDETPFNLINNNYGTYPNFATRNDIFTTNGYKNVYMSFIEGINIFDWMGVFERASEIHTVETSIYYLLDKMGKDEVTIYSRYPNTSDNFSYMKDHCNKNWKFIP
jgi:hypothetical protein